MKISRPRFDQLSRYRMAAVLFVLLYLFLMGRAFLHWPELSRPAIISVWFILTTPALVLIAWNLAQSSIYIYRKRRALDRMLDQRRTEKETT